MKVHRGRNGFTLLELMVVLVLLAITAAAAVPAFLGDRSMSAERRTATALAEALMSAREAARASGASATLVLSPADGRYWVTTRDSSSTGTLPMTGTSRIDGEERIQCRFEPNGPATPLEIIIRGAQNITVHVDGWSGDIRVDDDHPS